jgi:hypothetical protein
MDRQASLAFPALGRPFTAAQKCGNFLPGIHAAIGFRPPVDGLWMAVLFHWPDMAFLGPLWHFAPKGNSAHYKRGVGGRPIVNEELTAESG